MSDPIGNVLSITWWRNLFQKTGKAFGWGCAVVFGLPLVIGFGWNQFAGRGSQDNSAASRDATLMTVNGDTVTMGEYTQLAQSGQMGAPGEMFARQAGTIIDVLVQQAVITQEAKREGVKPNEADIDKAVQDFKERSLGKKVSDAEFENMLAQRGMTVSSFREEIAKTYLGKALADNAKKNTVVTEEEARNQSGEVHLITVFVPSIPATANPMMPPSPKALPDAAAKQRAESLLADVKSGKADINKVSKAEMGSDTGFKPEFKADGGMASPALGVLNYGKDVDEAVHKTKVGDYTEVTKASGFQSGYFFAKVVERRNNLPKDFAPQKAVDALKEERANEATEKKLTELTKAAKVVFPADRIEQKTYYDYFQLSKMQMSSMPFSRSTDPAKPEDIAKQQALVDADVEALYKKDPTNTNAAVLLLNNIQSKLSNPKTPPAEQTALRERLLPLYQNIIKVTEGDKYTYRFGLADALRDKKQFAEAYKNYAAVATSLNYDKPTDLTSKQDAVQIRQRLEMALKTIASPEAPKADADAAEQEQKIQALNSEIAALKIKEAEDRKIQEAARKKAEEEAKKAAEKLKSQKPGTPGAGTAPTTSGAPGTSLTLPPGSQSITIPATGATPTATPTPAPSTSGSPASGGQPKATPPAGTAGH